VTPPLAAKAGKSKRIIVMGFDKENIQHNAGKSGVAT
jgi:hypothetical protein